MEEVNGNQLSTIQKTVQNDYVLVVQHYNILTQKNIQ